MKSIVVIIEFTVVGISMSKCLVSRTKVCKVKIYLATDLMFRLIHEC